jgi:hypothetical protein
MCAEKPLGWKISRKDIMKSSLLRMLSTLPLIASLAACVGVQTFTQAARQGETVALALGWQKHLLRSNVTVTITDAQGLVTAYAPNDARVRGIVNLYPDPVSKAVVGTMTQQDMGVNAKTTGSLINGSVTSDDSGESDRDWWMTTMMLDLPATMASGVASINIADSAGATIPSVSIEILPGTSSANQFAVQTQFGTTLSLLQSWPKLLVSMERASSSTVVFSSSKDANGNTIIPHSIQMQFTHTANAGKPWVVNPPGDSKNVDWTDNGTNLIVILTPARGITPIRLLDFKFYIAGGITGLTQTSLKAYDINGALVAGVNASIQ